MEKRRCVLCQTDEGTLNHLTEECVATLMQVEEVVSGKINAKMGERLRDSEKEKQRKTSRV